MKNICKFLQDNEGLFLEIGEVGFGRPCVGILHKKSESYLNYCYRDDDLEEVCRHSARPAKNAYHKHECIAVLSSEITEQAALTELDDWLGRIMAEGYEIVYPPRKVDLGVIAGNYHRVPCIKNKHENSPTLSS